MHVGWCGRLERADQARRLGFDFLEVALGPMNLEDDAAYEAAKAAVRAAALPTPIFNQFLAKSMHVVGPDVDRDRIRRFLPRAADVMQAGGAEIAVLGGGWARRVPEGWSRERAEEQFLDLLAWSADALQASGIILALEAQNHTETNYITTIAEAVRVATLVSRTNVRVIADLHHLHAEPELFAIVTESADWIVHVHLSDSDRTLPGAGTYDLRALFGRLGAAGYAGRLSIECMAEVSEQGMASALQWVRECWTREREAGFRSTRP